MNVYLFVKVVNILKWLNDMFLKHNLPIIRNIEQNTMVNKTNHVFQSWLLFTVATPRNMKMIVSEDEDSIFIVYFIVVCDL